MVYQNLQGKHFLQTWGSSQQWAKACLFLKIGNPVTENLFDTLWQTGWEIYIYIRDYVWKGRMDTVAYVLTARKDQGDLNLANIQKCDQSLKISWVFYLEHDQVIENLAYYFLNQIGDLIWQCNVAREDVNILIPMKNFWQDMLYTWAQYNFLQPLNQEQVLEQVLWLKSAILVQNLPTVNTKVIKRGMLWIKDTWKQHILNLWGVVWQILYTFGIYSILWYNTGNSPVMENNIKTWYK